MSRPLSKAEACAFRRRWQRVNEREAMELRETSLDVRLQQFYTMLAWVREFDWTAELVKGEEEVRQRWIKLRKAYHG